MRRVVIVAVLVIIAVLGFFFLSDIKPNASMTSTPADSRPTISQQTNITSSFLIFTNGTKRIFTDSKYHNQSPDVYIEPTEPGIVHVRKSGTTWATFFATLPMKLTKDCLTTGTGQVFCTEAKSSLKFYINGVFDENALQREIADSDTLVVSYGPKDDPNVDFQLNQAKTIK